MKPVTFKHHSKILAKPVSMTEEQCESLPILQLGDTNISCWKAGWKDRLRILFTGKVWLGVLSGTSQPPVYVESKKPFTDDEAVAVKMFIESKNNFITFMSKKYGGRAMARAKSLDLAGVSPNDARRNLVVEKEDLEKACEFDILYIYGLRLVS